MFKERILGNGRWRAFHLLIFRSEVNLLWTTQKEKLLIVGWVEVGRAVMHDYADIHVSKGRQNNHLYWASWAVAVTGAATEKKELYEWGVGKVKYALHMQVQADGTLPLELSRGKKSLQYHVFALAPLVMISELALRNGEDLYEINDRALHRLVARTFEGLNDPAYFEQLTGYAQIRGDEMSTGHFSWLEAYNARFPDAKMEKFLKSRRPVISPRTGGDMTFLYNTAYAL
jgi:poly(beta-D-mannuronate) lyase